MNMYVIIYLFLLFIYLFIMGLLLFCLLVSSFEIKL